MRGTPRAVPGRSRPPSTSASVGSVESAANDCAGLAGAHGDATPSSSCGGRGRHPGLADLGSGAGNDNDRSSGVRASPKTSASAATSRSICGSVCAALTVTRRREVPGATVGGRIAGTTSPCASSVRRGLDRSLLFAAHEGQDRRRVPGRSRSTSAAEVSRRALRPSRDRHDPQCGECRGGVGRGRRGGEDVRAGPVLDEIDVACRTGDEAAERGERLRTGPDAQHVGAVFDRQGRSEHRVRLVEHEQCVLLRAQARRARRRRRCRRPSRTRVSLTTSARRGAPIAQEGVQMVEVAVPVDGHVGGREPAPVDDRSVVQLVGADQHAAVPNVVSTPRLAAKPVGNSAARAELFHAASSRSSSAWIGREPTISRADPGRAPAVERRRGPRRSRRDEWSTRGSRSTRTKRPGGRRRRCVISVPRPSRSHGVRQRPDARIERVSPAAQASHVIGVHPCRTPRRSSRRARSRCDGSRAR